MSIGKRNNWGFSNLEKGRLVGVPYSRVDQMTLSSPGKWGHLSQVTGLL